MGSCLSCFRGENSPEEREPLLPKEPVTYKTSSSLDKLVDILAGVQSGKLPSQDQLNTILRSSIDSNILKYNTQHLRGTGQLSRNGQRVIEDVNELLQSFIQLGLEKNMDDKLQDLLYQCSQLDVPTLSIDPTTAIEAGQERVAKLQAQAPTHDELARDTMELVRSLKEIARLLVASSAFRLLLSDMFTSARHVLAEIAADVASLAQQVEVAAEGVERATNIDGGSLDVLLGNVKGVAVDVSNELDQIKQQQRVNESAKDVFITRMQDFIVRAHHDPRALAALQNLLTIARKYLKKSSRSMEIISGIPKPGDNSSGKLNPVSVTSPTPEASQAWHNFKTIVERLASGQSLDPLLSSLASTITSIAESASSINDASTSQVQPDSDLQHYLTSIDLWLSRALSPSDPLYATSRNGTRALETIYDGGRILLTSSSGSSPPPAWTQNLLLFLDAYDTYTTALTRDRSTMRLVRALSSLHTDMSNFSALALGLGTYTGRRARTWRNEAIQDFLGWFLPRAIRVAEKIGVPMPRFEYKSGKIVGALDTLRMGPGQEGGVMLDLVPDLVVVRSSNETRIDMRDLHGHGARTSSSSRLQVHIDGASIAIKDLGFFFSYGSGLLGYADQGLLSANAEGLSLDIDISTDTEPDLEISRYYPPLFSVVDVHAVLPRAKFRINQSRHWILNKLLVQPIAGPVVEHVAAGVLEARIRSGLEKLSEGIAVVREQAQRIAFQTKHKDAQPYNPDAETETGVLDYWEALLERGPDAFGLTAAHENPPGVEVNTHSSTTATMKGVVYTTTTTTTAVESEGAASSSSQNPPTTEIETSIAVGGGAMLIPEEAGPYRAVEPEEGVNVVDQVTQDAEEMLENAEASVEDTVLKATELRGKIEHAEQRREARKEVESARGGWRSSVFDL